jgi:AraC family transcriptional regulator, regulatory protein of adaptative response / methylated-DNA-[protein]-cysteine methyltransferase
MPKSHETGPLQLTRFDSPLGAVAAAADRFRVHLLTFGDEQSPESACAELSRIAGSPVAPGENPTLQQLRAELHEYFQGQRREFQVPFLMHGTKFQRQVWSQLQRIPWGRTASYQDVASAVGNPAAVRAVGRANATNRLCLLVPCHRVIAKDGTLGGYSGGLWRKRFLLELEQTGTILRTTNHRTLQRSDPLTIT